MQIKSGGVAEQEQGQRDLGDPLDHGGFQGDVEHPGRQRADDQASGGEEKGRGYSAMVKRPGDCTPDQNDRQYRRRGHHAVLLSIACFAAKAAQGQPTPVGNCWRLPVELP